MNKTYLKDIPIWYKSIDKTNNLILSGDIDSLGTAAVFKKVYGIDIEYFYNFNALYSMTDKTPTNKSIGCDIDLISGMCVGNHITRLSVVDKPNPNCINLNSQVHRFTYKNKYCGSAMLTLWSLLELPLPKSVVGKAILLSIDGGYLGYYKGFKDTNKHYLCDVLGYPELYRLQEANTIEHFENTIEWFNLNAAIRIKYGKLDMDTELKELSKHLGIPVELPDGNFKIKKEFEYVVKNIKDTMISSRSQLDEKIVSIALTYKNQVKYTKKIV